MAEEDPTTQELRLSELKRMREERERAEEAPTPDAGEQHGRRADKAEYLQKKLEERAEAERRSGD